MGGGKDINIFVLRGVHNLYPCRGKDQRLLSVAAVISEWVAPRWDWTLERRSWVCCSLHTAHPWVQGKSAFRSYFWTCNYVLFCFVFPSKRQSWATCGPLLWPVGHWQEQSSETGQPASALTWLEWCPPQAAGGPVKTAPAHTCTHLFTRTHTHTHTHTCVFVCAHARLTTLPCHLDIPYLMCYNIDVYILCRGW